MSGSEGDEDEDDEGMSGDSSDEDGMESSGEEDEEGEVRMLVDACASWLGWGMSSAGAAVGGMLPLPREGRLAQPIGYYERHAALQRRECQPQCACDLCRALWWLRLTARMATGPAATASSTRPAPTLSQVRMQLLNFVCLSRALFEWRASRAYGGLRRVQLLASWAVW